MSRSEAFTSAGQIKKAFKRTDHPSGTAGPIVFSEAGVNYYDDSEAHILVDGNTGKGKSACVSNPTVYHILQKGESGIFIDPKGDLYRKTLSLAKKNHQVICYDFSNPGCSPDRCNLLTDIYESIRSEDQEERDRGNSDLSEFTESIYPASSHNEKFWSDTAQNLFRGLCHALFELGEPEQVHLESISCMLDDAQKRNGASMLLKDLYESLPETSLARHHLASYVHAPNETRSSIHCVAEDGLSVFSRSHGLKQMLGSNTVRIRDLDISEKPIAVYIIIPDETSTYDFLAGVLVSRYVKHFIRLARDKYNGRLPCRLNLVLEELASVGKSLTDLPNWMAAARSRNIRIMMVLQNGMSQLADIYGQSKAAAINSCIGITYAFSSNSWPSLNEWAQRCGERQVERGGHVINEPLITASQLNAMPVGMALILHNEGYKYVTRLPFFDEMYDFSDDENVPKSKMRCPEVQFSLFDMKKWLMDRKKSQLKDLFDEAPPKLAGLPPTEKSSENMKFPADPSFNVDDLIAQIDAKIAELEEEEKKEEKEEKSQKRLSYVVVVTSICQNRMPLIREISAARNIGLPLAEKLTRKVPFRIPFRIKKDAEIFLARIRELGCTAEMES